MAESAAAFKTQKQNGIVLIGELRKQYQDDLNRLVDGMLKFLRRLIGEDTELRWVPDEDLPSVRMDPAEVETLAARPDYLHTLGHDEVVNYSEWGVPLGRQFRALKLWFVLRAYGLEGLRAMIRNHIVWSRQLCDKLRAAPNFEIVTEPNFSLFSFRYAPLGAADLDPLNLKLVETINADGRIYLTQTRIDGAVAIRFQVGQFECTEDDVMSAYDVVTEIAARL